MEYKIDATNQTLGRLATKVALLLRGKTSPRFTPNAMPKTVVRISHIDKINVSGKKPEQKKYYRYSGYPGGMKEKTLKELFQKDPRIVFTKAVYGMLPKNRMRSRIIKNIIFE